jgi:hypothetical protein
MCTMPPRHMHVHASAPIMYETGRVYFRLEFRFGLPRWVSVRGVDVRHWLNFLLNYTEANSVEHLWGGRPNRRRRHEVAA